MACWIAAIPRSLSDFYGRVLIANRFKQDFYQSNFAAVDKNLAEIGCRPSAVAELVNSSASMNSIYL